MPLLPERLNIYKNTRELFETGSFPGHFGVLIFEIRRLSYFAQKFDKSQMREAPKSYSGSFDPADLLSPSILELEKVSAHVNRSDFRHSFIGQYIWPLAGTLSEIVASFAFLKPK